MNSMYDVIVIGASLAGSAASIEMAKRGLKVALVDRATFPRRKPCGEGLSALGLHQLERLGIKDRILQLPHIPYTGYSISVGTSKKFVRSPISGGITLQRYDFDKAVLDKALEYESVSPYLSSKVKNIEGTTVVLADRNLIAKKLVLACGGNSPLINSVDCTAKRYGPSRTGVSAIYKGTFLREVNWITILVKPKYEMYCTPLAGGFLNVSVLKKSNETLNIHSIFGDPSLMKSVFEECSFIGLQDGPLLGRTNIGNIRRQCSSPDIFLAGDVREEFDPIGGMGMSHALSSGIEVAHRIIKELSSDKEISNSFINNTRITSSMRRFTRLTYKTLIGAKYFPLLLNFSASTLGGKCIKILLPDS